MQQHLYIHGAYVKANSDEFFETINPATNQVICKIDQANEADVEKAVLSAEKGFAVWSAMSAFERSRILLKAVAILRERNDELAALEVMDTGKPLQEANCVDIASGADVIEYYAGLIPALQGAQQDLDSNTFFISKREPLGVCAGIGAWNYPIQIAMWKSAPCLAAGNSMLFKPSEDTPLSALKLAEIYTEAGMPPGVFNVVLGDYRVGQYLSRHPRIAKVSFTGGCETGKKVMADAAATIKEVTLELGGKSPLIIFNDADLDNAVSGALLANFYTQGEVCTNGTRVFVQSDVYDAFLDKAKQRSEAIKLGDPMDLETQMGALINAKHLDKVMSYINRAKASNARLICGGKRHDSATTRDGFFVEPTIFADCEDDMANVTDEIFGPVMSVLRFDDENEVVARANDTSFGLAAGVFTQDINRAHRVINQLQAGICWINSWGDSPAEMPVGGYKQSGIGRENGPETLKHYTQVKSIFIRLNNVDSPF
ncbi:MAG: betaine-aldehyde dehydrogenase [Gammaproteobacteria bacterium]|nr:betaine-aldehyde dehydrogenase [Gammaproteobacteria bacterium]